MRTSPRSIIRTAVFPVAGRGTRFLPATKASPKEMLPVVDKPLIQYAVEEALAAGATRLVFITGAAKRAIEDHFDSDQELEHMLEQQGKSDLLNQLRSVLPSYASCIYIRQPAPLGLGHAVLCAQPAVGAEPFFVHLADDLIRSDVACLQQMAEVYRAKRASVLGVQVVPRQDTDKYGIVAVEADKSATSRVRSIVEKPKPAAAPSNLAVVGRYVLSYGDERRVTWLKCLFAPCELARDTMRVWPAHANNSNPARNKPSGSHMTCLAIPTGRTKSRMRAWKTTLKGARSRSRIHS